MNLLRRAAKDRTGLFGIVAEGDYIVEWARAELVD
jgi:hypothetical protein